MEVQSLSCASCGAPINVPSDIDHLTCAYCGASLEVKRGEGYVSLRMAEEIGRTIEDSSEKTQTQLRRLQLTQELSSVQVRLTTLRSEIRSLEREKRTREVDAQLKELYAKERNLIKREKQLQSALAADDLSSGDEATLETRITEQPAAELRPYVSVGDKDWRTASALCVFLGWLGAHRFYTGHIVYGIIQFLTFGGFLVWWLIDLFMLATDRYRDSRGMRLQNPGGRFGESCLLSAAVSLVIFFAGMIVLPVVGPVNSGNESFSGVLMLVSMATGALAFAYLFFVVMKKKYG